jgi:hypothetical protein
VCELSAGQWLTGVGGERRRSGRQKGEGKWLLVAKMGKTGSGNGGRLWCPRARTGRPERHSTGGAVQMGLTGLNLNGPIGFKFLQILIDPKGTFPYSKNLK